MTTTFEYIPITDQASATRKVGGQELTQGADTLFLQGTLPMGNILEQVHTAALADTAAITITLTGHENYVIISTEVTAASATFNITGKDLNGDAAVPVFWERGDEFAAISSPEKIILYNGGGAADNGVFIFPTLGLSEIKLTNSSGSARAITWARASTLTVIDPPGAAKKKFFTSYTVAGTGTVSTGQVMTTNGQPLAVRSHLGFRTVTLVAVEVFIVAGTTAPTDVDLSFLASDATTEGSAAPTDYSLLLGTMPLEFRTTPTAGQYKSIGSGVNMAAFANGLSIPFTVNDGDGVVLNWIMIARQAVTGVDDIVVNFVLEV